MGVAVDREQVALLGQDVGLKLDLLNSLLQLSLKLVVKLPFELSFELHLLVFQLLQLAARHMHRIILLIQLWG